MSTGSGKCKEINQFVKVEYITKKSLMETTLSMWVQKN